MDLKEKRFSREEVDRVLSRAIQSDSKFALERDESMGYETLQKAAIDMGISKDSLKKSIESVMKPSPLRRLLRAGLVVGGLYTISWGLGELINGPDSNWEIVEATVVKEGVTKGNYVLSLKLENNSNYVATVWPQIEDENVSALEVAVREGTKIGMTRKQFRSLEENGYGEVWVRNIKILKP